MGTSIAYGAQASLADLSELEMGVLWFGLLSCPPHPPAVSAIHKSC